MEHVLLLGPPGTGPQSNQSGIEISVMRMTSSGCHAAPQSNQSGIEMAIWPTRIPILREGAPIEPKWD